VKDYVADVKVKIDVSFMKVPPMNGKLYFKAPDKMKLERDGGISILPKKSINLTMNNVIPEGGVTIIDAGYDKIGDKNLRVIKVVPTDERTDVVLTKIWVDEARLLAVRTETTTRDNGTIKMELYFGKYVNQALPDRITFYVDVKDYKLPKGVTMDYDGMDQPAKKPATGKPRKGRIEINYLDYKVNQGLSDAVFLEKKK
jgi:outer membrane lipoprotein-sorting protein